MSKVPLRDHFCIEPGFCITLHKAQGRTIRRLILSISDHPYHKLRHKWEGLYVGLSRVEHNEHMRLLLKRGDWGTAQHLLALERCKYNECFFKGYKRNHTCSERHEMEQTIGKSCCQEDEVVQGEEEKEDQEEEDLNLNADGSKGINASRKIVV